MRNWITQEQKTEDVAVLLFPQFSNHCLANAVEPLRAANGFLMREAYRWEYVTLDGNVVESSSGLPVLPQRRLRDHPGGAFLFVASSYDVRSYATGATSRALKSATRRFENVVGMDTGAWLMANAGLLDGATATIHWDELTAFSEAFVNVETVSDRYVIDGTRITCGGAMTSFDLVLDLITQRHGEALGLEVASLFLHRSGQHPPDRVLRQRVSAVVSEALALMSSNLEAPMPIGMLADEVQVSQRGLCRAFQSDLGAPPQTVYKRLRLSAARRYAQQSDYSITEIALRCGYRNAAAMTRAFVGQHGKPPRAFRSGG